MTVHSLRLGALSAVAASVLLLTACASTGAGAPGGGGAPAPDGVIAAPGQVVGQGTVIQTGDTAPQFCLGPVMESYPPQCSGPELVGWDWDSIEGWEASGDVTFGTYAVWGGWDGTRLTVESSVMLALYDPMPFVDPLLDPENAGESTDADLADIQNELEASAPFDILSMSVQNGYLFVDVVYDDGTIQDWVDDQYLPDTVAVRGALRDV